MGFGSGPKGQIRLADPDTFAIENINRQIFCTRETIGQNKAEAVAAALEKISPGSVAPKIYKQGVNESNIAEFLDSADIVIDETDYESHWVGIMIAREARKRGLRVFTGMNLAWGGQYTSFDPFGQTLEAFLGLSPHASLEELRQKPVGVQRWVSHLPAYVQFSVFREVQNGRAVPSVSPGVAIAAGNVATQIFRYIAGKPVITAPRVGWDDALAHKRGTVFAPTLEFLYTLTKMYVRSLFGRNSR